MLRMKEKTIIHKTLLIIFYIMFLITILHILFVFFFIKKANEYKKLDYQKDKLFIYTKWNNHWIVSTQKQYSLWWSSNLLYSWQKKIQKSQTYNYIPNFFIWERSLLNIPKKEIINRQKDIINNFNKQKSENYFVSRNEYEQLSKELINITKDTIAKEKKYINYIHPLFNQSLFKVPIVLIEDETMLWKIESNRLIFDLVIPLKKIENSQYVYLSSIELSQLFNKDLSTLYQSINTDIYEIIPYLTSNELLDIISFENNNIIFDMSNLIYSKNMFINE